MLDADFMKEFIRLKFMAGHLELGKEFEDFLRIMKGEMEALIAIDQKSGVDEGEVRRLLEIAQPTNQTFAEYNAWRRRCFDSAEPRSLSAS